MGRPMSAAVLDIEVAVWCDRENRELPPGEFGALYFPANIKNCSLLEGNSQLLTIENDLTTNLFLSGRSADAHGTGS